MKRVATFALAFALTATASANVACESSPSVRTFLGRLYDPAGDCLESASVLDVLETNVDPAVSGAQGCTPICITSPKAEDGSTQIYTSSECPPYPPGFDTSGADPRCVAALDALTGGRNCKTADAGK